MSYFSLNSSDCGFNAGSESQCSLEVGRMGSLEIFSRIHPCLEPKELAISLSMEKLGGWEMNFLSGNPVESRQIGPPYWPLWLRVLFTAAHEGSQRYTLKACIEAAKNGQSICFLNEDLTLPVCNRSQRNYDSIVAISALSAIFLALTIFLLAALCFWYRRNQRWKRYHRHVNASCSSSSGGKDSSFTSNTPPLLPGATMCDSVKETKAQRESLLRPPGPEEFWLDFPDKEFSLPSRFRSRYAGSARESKLIQTSLSILDATALLSPSNSSQESSEHSDLSDGLPSLNKALLPQNIAETSESPV